MNAPPAGVRPTRVWDAPTRLFHWTLVVLITLQYLTGEYDLLDMRWHFWGGYATLALVAFRILWGLFGSQTSRFTHFVRGPAAVMAHLRVLASAQRHEHVGHNPLGGWSVLVLLLSVTVQALTGLFSADDLDDEGPLAAHVSTRVVKQMTHLHHLNQNVLLGLIALHVVAVLLYLLLRRDNLITPMFSGRRVLGAAAPLRFVSAWRAVALLLACAAAVATLVWWAG
jgi:cytochrome b